MPIISWGNLRDLFMSKAEKEERRFVREVIETNPQVAEFAKKHPDYRIVSHGEMFTRPFLRELHRGPEYLAKPKVLLDYEKLEQVVRYDVMSEPKLVGTNGNSKIYGEKRLAVYADVVEKKVVEVLPYVDWRGGEELSAK